MNEKNKPMVSVVVLTYQSSKFIVEALESIKSQTWDNIELIISDDASTDGTVELCRSFMTENGGRFVNTEIITIKSNTGIPANYNRGIKAASGEWIKFVDGDDVLLESCIADKMAFAESTPEVRFIVSEVQEIDENSLLLSKRVINKGMNFITSKESSNRQLKAYVRYPFFINSPTFFVKKSLLEEIGYCDEEFRIFEDITMTMRALIHGTRIYCLHKLTVKYRIHKKSISRDQSALDKREEEKHRIFEKYQTKYLSKCNPLDLSVYYDAWLSHHYKGFKGRKGMVVLRKFSLHYWYMKLKGARTY